jgi:RNA recognition motif-containing protein
VAGCGEIFSPASVKVAEATNSHIPQEEAPRTNLFVRHIPQHYTADDLALLFSQYGEVTYSRVRQHHRSGRFFGFVCFETPAEAAAALKGMNGKILDGATTPLQVDLSEHDIAHLNEQTRDPSDALFVSNIVPHISTDAFTTAMMSLGHNVEVSFKKNSDCAFVRFESVDEAQKTLNYLRRAPSPELQSRDPTLLAIRNTCTLRFAETQEERLLRQKRESMRVASLQQNQAQSDREKATKRKSPPKSSPKAKSRFKDEGAATPDSQNYPPSSPTMPAANTDPSVLHTQVNVVDDRAEAVDSQRLDTNIAVPCEPPQFFYILQAPTPTFPSTNDIYIAQPLPEITVRQLLSGFGPVALYAFINPGICIRMANPALHVQAVQAINQFWIGAEKLQGYLVA